VSRVFLAALLVLLLPGGTLGLALGGCRRVGLVPVLGMSLALPSLVILWSTALGVSLTPALTWGGYLALLPVLGWLGWRSFRGRRPFRRWRWHDLALLACLALVLSWRFLQSAELVLPAWVDSLHHTHIVQVLLEKGRIPPVLESYAPIPFYYHYGFHWLTALFARLSGLPVPQAVLIWGQVLNALVSLALYALTFEVTRSRGAGLLAALLTGFISRFPAYYVSWGRYSLLMGVLLMAWAVTQALRTWRVPSRANALVLALLVAGLFLSHYLATLYFVAFIGALGIGGWRFTQRRRGFLAVLGACALALGLTWPWLSRIIPYLNPAAYVNTPTNASLFESTALVERYRYTAALLNAPGTWVLAAFALPMALLAWWRRRPSVLIVEWTVLMAILSHEVAFKIAPFRLDLLAITLFVPGNVLAAEGMVWLDGLLSRWSGFYLARLRRWLLVGSLVLWGMGNSVAIINPVTVLATAADVRALHWLEQQVPEEAVFLIGAVPWQGRVYRGTDGGWWIPLLTGRRTLLPPGIFYAWSDASYIQQVAGVAQQIMALRGCDAAFWDLVRTQGVTHLYIGPTPGPLKPEAFATCSGVHLIYQQDGVYIYRVVAPELQGQ